MPATPTLPEPSLSDLFALILRGVCRVAAARLARNRAATPVLLLLWSRLQRAIGRFARLAAAVEAGTLQPPRPRQPHPTLPGPEPLGAEAAGTDPARPAPPDPPRPRLPHRVGWLAEWVPETRAYGGQLRHLLTDPRMADLLRAAPQLGRIVRPLCRMLAVSPDPLPTRSARPAATTRPPPDGPPASASASAPVAAPRRDTPSSAWTSVWKPV